MLEDEKDEQTAVAEDPNEASKETAPADSGAAQEESLDELLKEFDSRSKPAEAAPKEEPQTLEPKVADTDVNALAVLEQRLNDQEAREQRRELDGLVNRLTAGVEATPLRVKGLLNALAEENPALNSLWMQRNVRPKEWQKAEDGLRKLILKEFGQKVDKQATSSRDAVASAVRSASTAAPQTDVTEAEIKSMPKDEFDELQRKLGVMPL